MWKLGLSSFSALVGRSWLRGQTLVTRHVQPPSHRSCAFFLAYCHPNLCTQPFLCPCFGEVFLSVMLNYSTASAPPVTPSWIVAQVTKPTTWAAQSVSAQETSLAKWRTFESNETYKPAGVNHHVSAIKHWEASLPGVKLHGFVADLWKHFRQIGVGLNLVVVFWCHNSGTKRFGRLRGCPFGAAACVQGCARLPMAVCALLQHHLLVPVQHYQDDHHCGACLQCCAS